MVTIVADSYEHMSSTAAEMAAGYINANKGALLCFAAGETPKGMFRALIAMQREGAVNLSDVFYAGLDEWAGLGYNDAGSCAQVMNDEFYAPAMIDPDRVHVFDGLDRDMQAQCHAMEGWIDGRGGIGLAVLGVGMNGHIGFNEPGAPDIPGCFTVRLDDTTKRVSSKYFGRERAVEEGITISWRTLKLARRVILMASGGGKADVVRAMLARPNDPSLPASLLLGHPGLTILIDRDVI